MKIYYIILLENNFRFKVTYCVFLKLDQKIVVCMSVGQKMLQELHKHQSLWKLSVSTGHIFSSVSLFADLNQ